MAICWMTAADGRNRFASDWHADCYRRSGCPDPLLLVNEKSVIVVSGITKYLVAASALAMALAAAPAPAAIVVSQTFAHEAWELGDVIDSVLSEITDFATPGAGALPLEIPGEQEERQRLLETPDCSLSTPDRLASRLRPLRRPAAAAARRF